MTGPSLGILRYGVTPTFPVMKASSPARVRVTGRAGAYRWTCTVCVCPSMRRTSIAAAADAGRRHLHRWHT